MTIFKKIFKFFKLVHIDLFVYSRKKDSLSKKKMVDIKCTKEELVLSNKKSNNKIIYELFINGNFVHRSVVFKNVHVVRLIHKLNTPVIGACYTTKSYRGKSIYPFVLEKIAKKLLQKECNEILILVSPLNNSSIKGIEKANFTKICRIKADRIGIIYFNKNINWS